MTNPFSASSKEAQEGYPRVRQPGIYEAILYKVDGSDWETQNNEVISKPLRFTFRVKDEQKNIYEHMHVEFPPREDDSNDKIHKKVLRIAHIISKVINQEFEFDASSWEEIHDKTTEILSKHDAANNAKNTPLLYIKLVGNVYNGQARGVQFTGYPGFIKNAEEKAKPTFSRNEERQNQDYLNKLKEDSKADQEKESGPEVGDLESEDDVDKEEDAPF